MFGKVTHWRRDTNNPTGKLFGWGFLETTEGPPLRVYLNEKSTYYSPVQEGDVVEFEFREPNERGPSAMKVRKVGT